MKKLLLFTLTLIMCLSGVAGAAVNTSDIAYYNPLPDIYDAVSPAVAELDCVTWKWDAATDTVTKINQGSGSAVYVDARGYFITNSHVVEDADELEIKLYDGTVLEAEVVGNDEAVDVAVIKVSEAPDITPVTVGTSSNLRVGELVCVIGTPYNGEMMFNTLGAGYISGLNRNMADPESNRAVDLIQIDVAINPGNSGGALLNAKGELIGLPFLKYMFRGPTGAAGDNGAVYENLSFAVPIDAAWTIASSLIETGTFSRPRFGVSVTDNNGPEDPLKNYPPAGLKIETVDGSGSGYRAGLRVGDVITHVNGTRIYTFREYTKIIDKLPAGESFEITVARYKDEKGEALKKFEILNLTVTLEMID